jgi:hypothetical protein
MEIAYTYSIKDGRCKTICPNSHITIKQKSEYAKTGYRPNIPYVFSASCEECEFYNGIIHGKVNCNYDKEAHS